MEKNVRKQPTTAMSTTAMSATAIRKPEMRDLFKEFVGRMKSLTYPDKLDLVYTKVTGSKPKPELKSKRKFDRIIYELEFGKKIKETKNAQGKKVKMPKGFSKLLKKNKKKKGNNILILYYRIRGDIKPMIVPLYGGNMIIIRNKPYEVDPRAFFKFGKHQCMSFKEIDRRPISNLDYEEVRKRGDSTSSDELLIKAVLKAVALSGKKPIDKKMLIWVGLAIAAAVIFFSTQ